MTDNEFILRPWNNVNLLASITKGSDKTYLYLQPAVEAGQPDFVLSAPHPDLAVSMIDEPPLFQYPVGIGMLPVVCVEIICVWEEFNGAKVERFF